MLTCVDMLFWAVGDSWAVTGACGGTAVREDPKTPSRHRPQNSQQSPARGRPLREEPSLAKLSVQVPRSEDKSGACLQLLQLVSGCLQLRLPDGALEMLHVGVH